MRGPARLPATRGPGPFLAALLTVTGSVAAGPDLEVAPDHPAYEVLRRAQTRGTVVLPGQAFPLPESAAEAWIAGRPLSPYDATLLHSTLPGRRRELVRWDDSAWGNSLYLSPAAEAGFRGRDGDSSETAYLGGVGLTAYGHIGPGARLSYYTRGVVYTESTDRPQFTHQFDPDFGETYSVEKGAGDSLLTDRTFNRYEYYLLARPGRFRLKAGRDRVHTGPGSFSSLLASRETPPYPQIAATLELAPWLTVDSRLLRMSDSDHDILKYANLHRFELRPLPSLALGFQDIVLYQDRDADWRYALPLAPLAFAEDNQGGKDNDAMGFDFLYAGVPGLALWGELFIDDLLGPGAFFDDFWENRWAVLAGFQAVSPWPGLDADLAVEFSRVEPWTYIGRQPQTGFRHFNVPSASKLGPDSRSLDVQLSWRPLAWLELRERLERNEKGLGRPGTLGVVHDDAVDGLTKELLAGPVREQRLFRTEARVLLRQYLRGRLAWTRDFGDVEADLVEASLLATW